MNRANFNWCTALCFCVANFLPRIHLIFLDVFPIQQFYGAARLAHGQNAFGQNPEIVSSTSTPSSSTTTQSTIMTTIQPSSLSEVSVDSTSGAEHESTPSFEITSNGDRRSAHINGAKVPFLYFLTQALSLSPSRHSVFFWFLCAWIWFVHT